jgi:hypothetical protein
MKKLHPEWIAFWKDLDKKFKAKVVSMKRFIVNKE